MNLTRQFVLWFALVPFAAPGHAQNMNPAPGFARATNAAHVRPAALPRRPSIIFIACQGLALGDLGCYGQTNFQTPNLDRLAAGGMTFTDYRAAADALPEAQAALMAGNRAPFTPGQPTLAARLQQAGYHTGLIGEWTLGPQPWTQGFDEFAGYLNQQDADNYYSDFMWRHAPKSVYDQTNRTLKDWDGREQIYANAGRRKGQFIPDLMMTAAANFVRENVPDAANHYRPFFLLVNLPAPHSVSPGKDDYPVPTDAPFSGENWPQAARNRAALLTRFDDQVGRLFERLKSLGLTNHVAFFLAGAVAPEAFADTNLDFLKLKNEVRGGHSEARLRVPMLVYWPGHVPAGRVSDAPWSAPDFAPTALEIAAAKPASGFTGVSMLPTLLGEPGSHPPALPNHSLGP